MYINSFDMAVILASDSFKALSANHALLKRVKRPPFHTHKMNGFINTTGPKVRLRKLTKKQYELLKQKASDYRIQADRDIFKASVLTLVLSSAVLLGASELIRYLF